MTKQKLEIDMSRIRRNSNAIRDNVPDWDKNIYLAETAYDEIRTTKSMFNQVVAKRLVSDIGSEIGLTVNGLTQPITFDGIKSIIDKSTIKDVNAKQIMALKDSYSSDNDGNIDKSLPRMGTQIVNAVLKQIEPNTAKMKTFVSLREKFRAVLNEATPIQNAFNVPKLIRSASEILETGIDDAGNLLFPDATSQVSEWDDDKGSIKAMMNFANLTIGKAKVNDVIGMGFTIQDNIYGQGKFGSNIRVVQLACTNGAELVNQYGIASINHQTLNSFARQLGNMIAINNRIRLDTFDSPYNDRADNQIRRNLSYGYLLEQYPDRYVGLEDRYYRLIAETIASRAVEMKDKVVNKYEYAAEQEISDMDTFFDKLLKSKLMATLNTTDIKVMEEVFAKDDTVHRSFSNGKWKTTLYDASSVITRAANAELYNNKLTKRRNLQKLGADLVTDIHTTKMYFGKLLTPMTV